MQATDLLQRLGLLVFLCLTLQACSGFQAPDSLDQERLRKTILLPIQTINNDLVTCKGTGWLSVTQDKKTTRYRIAWAAALPDRLRVVLLMAGRPVETIAADGQTVRFFSHTGSHAPQSITRPDPSLEPFLGLPVNLKEIISLLAGQIPVRKHDRLTFGSHDDERGWSVLTLKKNWQGTVQEIFLDDRQNPAGFCLPDPGTSSGMVIRFVGTKTFDRFSIPKTTLIQDSRGNSARIDIDSFSGNIPLKPGAFVLTETG